MTSQQDIRVSWQTGEVWAGVEGYGKNGIYPKKMVCCGEKFPPRRQSWIVMSDETLERLLHRFARAAERHNSALETMDEEGANRQAFLISRLFASIAAHGVTGRARLLALLASDQPAVAGMAAVYSLRYATQEALPVLRRIAGEPGLLGFRAGMAIERWERGEWEID